jgi:photosystem II stability/assembly factor-like uncharacterized protein
MFLLYKFWHVYCSPYFKEISVVFRRMEMNRASVVVLCFFLAGVVLLWISYESAPQKSSYLFHPPSAENGLEICSMQRAYPAKTIPSEGFYKAYVESKLRSSRALDHSTHDAWSSIGPANFAGRTISLALHPSNPDVVYAGSASGGLWRLTITGTGNEDYSWERIETGFPVLGVGSIAIDPRDPRIIYIGTGEVYGYQGQDGDLFGSYWMRIRGNYGLGILKSYDGGESWQKSLDWTKQQQRGVLSLAIDPAHPDNVFAGTTEGIFRSRNAGESWSRVHSVVMAVDIKIDPVNPKNIYAACGNLGTEGHGIYRSQDGGRTWAKLSTGLPESWTGKAKLDIYAASPNIVYADIANQRERIGLYKSEDSGDTWDLLSTLEGLDFYQGQGYYSHFVRVNPIDNQKIFIAKVGYLFSEDGGRFFTRPTPGIYDFIEDPTAAHGDIHAFVNHPGDSDTFYMAGDGGVHITENGGRTFRGLNRGYVNTQFYRGFSSSKTDPDFAIGGMQDNGTAHYTGSPEWRCWVTVGDGGYSAIDPVNANVVYQSSQWLTVYRSSNRFTDEENVRFASPFPYYYPEEQRHPGSEYAAFIAPFVLVESDFLYAATNYVYWSDDGGSTWTCTNGDQPLNGLPVVALGASPLNRRIVYAATAPYSPDNVRPMFYASRDGGLSWNHLTGNLPDRYCVDIVTSPHNEDVLYIALSGFGTSHLFRSVNGGLTWQDIGRELPDVPTSAVAVDPLDHRIIYVGNDIGVWVSTDYGLSWNVFCEGLPEAVMVMDLSVSETNRMLRAATHGNGVYERALLPPTTKNATPPRR